MRIVNPQNQFGQDLLSTGDVVSSVKSVTKEISAGAVEVTKEELGSDSATEWTVLEVYYDGVKMLPDVETSDEKLVVRLDEEDSDFTSPVKVVLVNEKQMGIAEEAQPQPIVVQGAYVDENGEYIGKAVVNRDVKTVGNKADFTEVTNSSYMFYNCSTLANFESNLPSLTNGSYMFYSCRGLSSWDVALPSLVTAPYMFYGCEKLSSWNVALPSLAYSSGMFAYCSGLTEWSVNLPNVYNGNMMFYQCTKLTSWNGDLPLLTNGTEMFGQCSKLESFNGDMPLLAGTGANNGGYRMFMDCNKLTNFKGDVSKLAYAYDMFYGCQLNEESILHILNTIPTWYSSGHYLHLGKNTNFKNSQKVAEKLGVTTPIAPSTSYKCKGWTITITS